MKFTLVKKILFLLIITTSSFIVALGQTTNYRAQGNYYSAKKNFESQNFAEAISYVNKSKASLGGTNEELQYLHILSAFKLELYEEAKKEMELFFDLGDKKVKSIYFDKSVDRLSSDETRSLTMLMDPIFEMANKQKNHPCLQCSGTGKISKAIYTKCSNCGNADRSHYLVDYNDGSRIARKGLVTTEKKGHVRSTCKDCNGRGMEVCSRCSGLGSKSCKSCGTTDTVWRPTGFSYFCNTCEGNGNLFSLCTNCNGNKTLSSYSSSEKTTCTSCKGRGF